MKSNFMDILYKVDRILEKTTHITSNILMTPCLFIFVAWVFLIGVFVIARHFFGVTWMFVEEFTEYWMVLVVYFSLGYTLRNRGHIKIDILIKMFPKRIKSILALINAFLALVLVFYLTWRGFQWFWYGLLSGERSVFPSNMLLWPFYSIVFIGLVSLGMELALQLCRIAIRVVCHEEAELM